MNASADGPCLIKIEGVEVFAYHGVLPEEKRDGQRFLIDVTLEMPGLPARDELSSTIDYAAAAELVAGEATGARYDLIESLAGHLVSSLLDLGGVRRVTVTVAKPDAPMGTGAGSVSVTASGTRAEAGGHLTASEEEN